MELKLMKYILFNISVKRSNRTFMELKSPLGVGGGLAGAVLIAPLWN